MKWLLAAAFVACVPMANWLISNVGMNGSAAAERHARYTPPTPARIDMEFMLS